MDNGWVKIHRKMLDWEWFTDVNVAHLFFYCLLSANHEPKNWRGIQVYRGQFVTSLDSITAGTGLSVRQARTALDKLESTGEIEQETTNKYRIITVLKYNSYQVVDDVQRQADDKQTSNKRQTNDKQDDKQATTTKNIRREEDIITHTSRVRENDDSSSIVVLPIDALYREHRDTLANETEISNSFIRYYKSSLNYEITRNDLAEYLDAFHAWLQQQGTDMKSMRDYRRHFSSWLQIQIKDKLKSQKNGISKRYAAEQRLQVKPTTEGNDCNF